MSATISLYNHTVNRFNTGANAVGDTYKVMLLNDEAEFDATDTTLTEVSEANTLEVSGGGWPAWGVTLTGVTLTAVAGGGGKFDANNILQEITNEDLGPYQSYVIYNDSDNGKPPVAFVSMDAGLTVTDGNAVGINWHDDGIIVWSVS
jgi:hypothetical protein